MNDRGADRGEVMLFVEPGGDGSPGRIRLGRSVDASEPLALVDDEVRTVLDILDDLAERRASGHAEGLGGTAHLVAEGFLDDLLELPAVELTPRTKAEMIVALARRVMPPDPHGGTRWRAGAGTPRGAFAGPPNALFTPGMNEDWQLAQVEDGLLKHGTVLSVAVPRDLAASSLGGRWWTVFVEPLLSLQFRRDGADCPADATQAIADERADGRLARSRTEQIRGPARWQAWLVHHLLAGMAPARLRELGGDRYEIAYLATDLAFGDDLGRPQDTYLLPDVRVTLEADASGARVREVSLRYRDTGSARYARGGEATYGVPVVIDMASPSTPAWRKERARRIVASASVVHGQIDQHIVLGHLIPEFLLVSMRMHLDADHPVRRVLEARLLEVDLVNRSADAVIWGPEGLIPVASALTSAGMTQRFVERFGAFDWKGFRPRTRSFGPWHHEPLVNAVYWDEVVVPYVRDALEGGPTPIEGWWSGPWGRQARAWMEEIAVRSPPWHAWDGDAEARWFDASDLGRGKAPGDRAFSLGTTREDLLQIVRFALYAATLAHTWANVRQAETGGEIRHASFGLRAAIDGEPFDGGTDERWHAAADPLPCDQGYQLAVADVLTFLDVDTFAKELAHATAAGSPTDPVHWAPTLAERFVATIGSLTAILQARPAGTFEDPFVTDLTKHLSRPNR